MLDTVLRDELFCTGSVESVVKSITQYERALKEDDMRKQSEYYIHTRELQDIQTSIAHTDTSR